MPPRGFEPRTTPPQGVIISSLTIGAKPFNEKVSKIAFVKATKQPLKKVSKNKGSIPYQPSLKFIKLKQEQFIKLCF